MAIIANYDRLSAEYVSKMLFLELFRNTASVALGTGVMSMWFNRGRGVQLANNTGREQSRKALQIVRGWEAQHLIVAHSPWLCVDGDNDARELLDTAFDWLVELLRARRD